MLTRSRRRPAFLILTLGLFLTACAAELNNTATQNLAYQRWSACRGLGDNALLERVEPDGRIWFRYVQIDTRDRILSCLRAQGQTGPTLPAPVGEIYPRS